MLRPQSWDWKSLRVCVEGTPVLSLIFPGSFLFRYEWCFPAGVSIILQGILYEVGVKSDSPFMFIHIPPACITGMQKLTFFPQDQTRHSFFFNKTNLNKPFYLPGRRCQPLCLSPVCKGADERLLPFTSPGMVQELSISTAGNRSFMFLALRSCKSPEWGDSGESLCGLGSLPSCRSHGFRFPWTASLQRTYQEAWASQPLGRVCGG